MGVGASVGALVTRGVTAAVGAALLASWAVGWGARRGAGSARPAFRKSSAPTAAKIARMAIVLSTCQMVMRSRRPGEMNWRPHQSHSVAGAGLRPPQPGQCTICGSVRGESVGTAISQGAPAAARVRSTMVGCRRSGTQSDHGQTEGATRCMATVIAVANQKGGVGKTTTTANLGAALKMRGQRVLLIDLDPQGNLTSAFGLEKEIAQTVADSLLDRRVPLPVVAVPNGRRPATTTPRRRRPAVGGARLRRAGHDRNAADEQARARAAPARPAAERGGEATTTCSSTRHRRWAC